MSTSGLNKQSRDFVIVSTMGCHTPAQRPSSHSCQKPALCKVRVTLLGWFSMSPLPRLHHHDIMTIVGLLLTRHDKVLFSHFYTERKKKRKEKFHSLALALTLTLTATLRPDHSTTTHCCRLQCISATFNAPTLRDVRMVRICIYDVLTVRE